MRLEFMDVISNYFEDMSKQKLKEVKGFELLESGDVVVKYKNGKSVSFTQDELRCPDKFNGELEACKSCGQRDKCLSW